MKSKVKFFMLGFVFCALLGGLVYGATQVAEVYFPNFPITVNDESYTSTMPILNYQGRTYLPLREFGNATGTNVDFVNNTIIINNSKSSEQQVYMTKTGNKYHYDNRCNGGTYMRTTLEDAINFGLQPCEKCVIKN